MWVENRLNETLNTEERTKKTLLNSFIKKQKDLNKSEQDQLFNAVRNVIKNMSMDYLKKNSSIVIQKINDKKNELFGDKAIKAYREVSRSQQTTPQSRTWVESEPEQWEKKQWFWKRLKKFYDDKITTKSGEKKTLREKIRSRGTDQKTEQELASIIDSSIPDEEKKSKVRNIFDRILHPKGRTIEATTSSEATGKTRIEQWKKRTEISHKFWNLCENYLWKIFPWRRLNRWDSKTISKMIIEWKGNGSWKNIFKAVSWALERSTNIFSSQKNNLKLLRRRTPEKIKENIISKLFNKAFNWNEKVAEALTSEDNTILQKRIEEEVKKEEKKIKTAEILERAKNKISAKLAAHTDNEVKKQVESLPPTTKEKLEENWIDETEYAKQLLTRQAILANPEEQKKPEAQEFLNKLSELENLIFDDEMDYVSESPIMWDYIDKTEWWYNKGFGIEQTNLDNNQTIQAFTKDEFFWILDWIDYFWEIETFNFDEIKIIINNFDNNKILEQQPELQKVHERIKKLIEEKKKEEDLDDDEKKLLKEYADKIKLVLSNDISQYIKQATTLAPATWIIRYLWMDNSLGTTLMDWKPLAEQLLKGENDRYHIDEKGTMTIDWMVWWNSLKFYLNLKDPNWVLKCEDLLNYNIDGNQFNYWRDETKTKEIKDIKIPRINEILEQIINTDSAKFRNLLLDSKWENYTAGIANLINNTINDSFVEDQNTREKINHYAESNLVIGQFIQTFVQSKDGRDMREFFDNSIKNWEEVKKLMRLIDITSENQTTTQVKYLRKSFEKIKELREYFRRVPQEIEKIADETVKEKIKKINNLDFNTWNIEERAKTLNEFFDYFTIKRWNEDLIDAEGINEFIQYAYEKRTDNIINNSKIVNSERYKKMMTKSDQALADKILNNIENDSYLA